MNIASAGCPLPTCSKAWEEIARLCRTICLLRARGNVSEAARLETAELPAALAAARREAPGGVDLDAQVRALFAAEAERVAAALTMAEVLVPLLAERLPGRGSPRDARHPRASPARPRPDGSAPPIADFIDQMLGRETAPVPRPAAG